jgi:hypothetical protein
MHLDRMPQLMKVYPDACLVWPHRDPVRALASIVSLVGTVHWGRSDHPYKGDSFAAVVDPAYSGQRLSSLIDMLEAGVVSQQQFFNVQYKDLVTNTLTVIDAMYRHFGIELSAAGRAAMAKYLGDNPRDARPSHRFSLGSPEAVARARQAYRRYQTYFGVADE